MRASPTSCLILGAALAACSARRVEPAQAPAEAPRSLERPAQLAPDPWSPAEELGGAGLPVALALPEGWRRRAEGDLLIAAPVDGGLRLSLRGWAEGDVVVPADGAVAFRTETLAEGLGERLGGKVRCASWQPSEGGASFAWYGVVGGRGFLLVADLPADDFEQAWAELARLLDGLEPR